MSLMKTFTTVLVLLVLVLFLFVWLGVFNVAATEKHSKLTLKLISIVRDRSIAVRAVAISGAPPLTDPQLIKSGFRSYHTMCITCHSAPGRKATPIRKGLNPKPPRLDSKAIQEMSNEAMYWSIEHGIRMTGMPAFGPTHSQEKIWGLVAFVRQLPKLSPPQYQAMVTAEGLPDEMADADEDDEH
jgi:mono/diheme cytochrome c family protein